MTFSSTVLGKVPLASREGGYMTFGTWTGTSVTTGELDVQLSYVKALILTPAGAAVANAPVYNETIPGVEGGIVTIIFDSGDSGSWIAFGNG